MDAVLRAVTIYLFLFVLMRASGRRTFSPITPFDFVLLIIGRIWFEGLQEVGVILGLASAGLAIALRDPLCALAGWLFILTRRPYTIGDRIQVGETFGDVIDIRMFQTYLLECGNWIDGDQSTGRIVLIPNSSVFSIGVANYTHGFEFIWDEAQVRLTFESDWRRAKEILTEIAEEQTIPLCQDAQQQIRRAASQHLIFFQKLTPIVYTSVRERGVQLTVRYLTPVRQRRGTAQRIWEATLDAFAKEPRIAFAYPTTRFFQNPQEGKPDLVPPTEQSIANQARE
jgi:small-conductance mechanosensitive channel